MSARKSPAGKAFSGNASRGKATTAKQGDGATRRSHLYARIYALVCEIPPGQVATYGQIARLIGCTARVAGFAMAATPPGGDVPWQRVINSQGRVSPRSDGSEGLHQRRLLVSEGVFFDKSGRVDLQGQGWAGPGWEWLDEHGYDPANQ